MASISQDSLISQIAELEATLATLDREQERVGIRLERLRNELAALNSEAQRPAPSLPSRASSMTPEEKVTLFRSLFRGRGDVYPRLWENARTGKKGYAPACSNEWVRGVCEKPRVKCGECPNQAFLPVTDEVVVDHLQGRHVVGVYPLLKDETCWFLAVAGHTEEFGGGRHSLKSGQYPLPGNLAYSRRGAG